MINPRQAFYTVTVSLTVINRLLIIIDNYNRIRREEKMHASMFHTLSDEEEAIFRRWARKNYRAFSDIRSNWHPVVQHECALMNIEQLKDRKNAHATM